MVGDVRQIGKHLLTRARNRDACCNRIHALDATRGCRSPRSATDHAGTGPRPCTVSGAGMADFVDNSGRCVRTTGPARLTVNVAVAPTEHVFNNGRPRHELHRCRPRSTAATLSEHSKLQDRTRRPLISIPMAISRLSPRDRRSSTCAPDIWGTSRRGGGMEAGANPFTNTCALASRLDGALRGSTVHGPAPASILLRPRPRFRRRCPYVHFCPMAIKIAVSPRMAGTGKTTAVRHPAECFSRAGLSVPAVDLTRRGTCRTTST